MTPLKTPPSRIYLLRHAKSAWAEPGGRDFDRSLSDAGFAEAELLAERAADLSYRPEMIFSSTATRCRQTAEAIARAFSGLVELQFVDALYNAPAETYLEILNANNRLSSMMVVGHNPAIEEVFAHLVGDDIMARTVPEGYPPAGLAVIDTIDLAGQGHSWALKDFLVA